VNGGHCTAGSPRFVVRVDGVDFSLGCASGPARLHRMIDHLTQSGLRPLSLVLLEFRLQETLNQCNSYLTKAPISVLKRAGR
jgi:hypothetical protein